MRIILIRHGDPDYANDTLTEKGMREAKLLAERVARWQVTDFYCSPLGRAQKTASYSLEKLGRTALTCDWMKEFAYRVEDPVTGRVGVPWDFMPEYWTEIPEMYDKEAWKKTDIYRSNPELLPAYQKTCEGLDRLLKHYGYQRHHNYYIHTEQTLHTNQTPDMICGEDKNTCVTQKQSRAETSDSLQKGSFETKDDHKTIVIFCHLGITCVMLSHLLGISPALLFHGFYLAPTSVTILASEERMNRAAYFRVQAMGDTTHLLSNGEPVSAAGYFADVFQG